MKTTLMYTMGLSAVFLLSSCSGNSIRYDACGQIEATEITVSAENSGKIIWLQVEEGDRLQAGQFVGCLDTMPVFLQKKELEERREGARSKLIDPERQLAPQRASLENLRKDYERYKTLQQKEAGTQKQVDDIEVQLKMTARNIAAQQQTYDNNNRSVRKEMDVYTVQAAQKADQLQKCRITAPAAGTVLTKYAEEGEMVTTGTPIFQLADLDHLYVRAYFTTRQLSGLKLGSHVQVLAEDGTEQPRTYDGEICWIADRAEFTPKNIQTRDEQADLVYAAKIRVNNDGYLRIGMYAYVQLP